MSIKSSNISTKGLDSWGAGKACQLGIIAVKQNYEPDMWSTKAIRRKHMGFSVLTTNRIQQYYNYSRNDADRTRRLFCRTVLIIGTIVKSSNHNLSDSQCPLFPLVVLGIQKNLRSNDYQNIFERSIIKQLTSWLIYTLPGLL